MTRLRCIFVVLCATLLSACAGTGIRAGDSPDRGERWQLSGKIGLRAPQLAESAYINWRQCGDRSTVRISGPLGQTVARIDGQVESLTLHFEGREPMITRDPESLMQQQLGWSLPIRALRYWVRAQAAPGGDAAFSGPESQPTALSQQEWRIEYLAYHQSDAAVLPAKLRLIGTQHLQATLLINEWSLGDATDCPVN